MKTTVLYFGNELVPEDRISIETVDRIMKELPGVDFIHCRFPEDVVRYRKNKPFILDVARGIEEVTVIEDTENISTRRVSTLHDFGLSFFLKLFEKTEPGFRVKIITIPANKKSDKKIIQLLKSQ